MKSKYDTHDNFYIIYLFNKDLCTGAKKIVHAQLSWKLGI